MSNLPTITLPRGFRLERGLVWPDIDVKCAQVIFDMERDLEHVWPFITNFNACVQAGGNCGIWPRALSKRFGVVYTAEPQPENFVALTMNTSESPNIIRLQAAFGHLRGLVKMDLAPHEQRNIGAYFVSEMGGNNFIPTLRIDDLNVGGVGLIYLDIEGMEQAALWGAGNTISRSRPVVVVEDKGLSEKYGTAKGDVEKMMESEFGYKVAKRVHRDIIMVHDNRRIPE